MSDVLPRVRKVTSLLQIEDAMTLPRLRLSIAIIDANPLLADGISALLLQDSDFVARTVFLGRNVAEMSEQAPGDWFDVVIIDPTQTDATPSSVIEDLNCRAGASVAYSSSLSTTMARNCIAAGFRGILPKTVSVDVLRIALATTAQGGIFIDSAYVSAVMQISKSEDRSDSEQDVRLSQRELSVLKSVAHGKSMKEIGKELDLSSKTVETYKARGSSKLNLSGRRQIVEFAIAHGWVDSTRRSA
jgi:two-component system, NarL family, nitrate/nitrite response regulator NarL